MWQLPSVERARPEMRTALFPPDWTSGARLALGPGLFDLRHTITKHRIVARVRRATATRVAANGPYRWVEVGEIGALAVTGMTKKALARAMHGPD